MTNHVPDDTPGAHKLIPKEPYCANVNESLEPMTTRREGTCTKGMNQRGPSSTNHRTSRHQVSIAKPLRLLNVTRRITGTAKQLDRPNTTPAHTRRQVKSSCEQVGATSSTS